MAVNVRTSECASVRTCVCVCVCLCVLCCVCTPAWTYTVHTCMCVCVCVCSPTPPPIIQFYMHNSLLSIALSFSSVWPWMIVLFTYPLLNWKLSSKQNTLIQNYSLTRISNQQQVQLTTHPGPVIIHPLDTESQQGNESWTADTRCLPVML